MVRCWLNDKVQCNDLTMFEQLHPLFRLLRMLVTFNMMYTCFAILTNKHENKDNIRWKNRPMEAIHASPSLYPKWWFRFAVPFISMESCTDLLTQTTFLDFKLLYKLCISSRIILCKPWVELLLSRVHST